MQILSYDQTTAASTWTITHNFGHKPVLDVWVDFEGERQKILPYGITHLSDDITQVNFTEPFTGSARLVALGDKPIDLTHQQVIV